MKTGLSSIDLAKKCAAQRAVDFVADGMTLGLGTGSTAVFMLRCLSERIKNEGLCVTGVPTSQATADLAKSLAIPLTTLDEVTKLDLTIDGADEVDKVFNLIKGAGAALLREKIVAWASKRMIVIADTKKEVETLGKFPLPVEVIPFGWKTTRQYIKDALADFGVTDCLVQLRHKGQEALRTEQGNYIVDLHLAKITNPAELGTALNRIPGVVENGLFTGLCDCVIYGHPDGQAVVRCADDEIKEELPYGL